MELTMVLVLFAAGWSVSLALAVGLGTADGVVKPPNQGNVAIRRSRSLATCRDCLWLASQNGTVFVPYVISPAYSKAEKSIITDAISHFELMTCVRFVQREAEVDYLSVEPGEGCWSYIAKLGGKQKVSLNEVVCMVPGIIQHEFMHSLGFNHEQSRSDRDEFVDIKWEEISEGYSSFFTKVNGNNLDLPYDYNSIMHSPNNTFSKSPNKATIIPKPDPEVPIGQRIGMSQLDVVKINTLYKCDVCRKKIMDPSGFFSTDGLSFGQDCSCLWFIQAEMNKQVHLQLSDLLIPQSPGCSDSYIKVYDGNSTSSKVLLEKTCGDELIQPLMSRGNSMLVEFVSNQDPALSRFNATYTTQSSM